MTDLISEHNPKCAAIVWPNGKVKCNCHVAEIERLRAALQQVWDCEEYESCPTCKLIARAALEDV